MIKDVLSLFEYSLFAETALVIFAVVFIAVCVKTIFAESKEARRHAELPLEESRNSNLRNTNRNAEKNE